MVPIPHTESEISMFNQNTFIVGNPTTFIYNDKTRIGTVEKVAPTFVTLKITNPDGSDAFKSFTYDKISK